MAVTTSMFIHPALARYDGLNLLRREEYRPNDAEPIEIHLATEADAPGLVRLAQLDSALAAAAELPTRASSGDVLVATIRGRIVAALALADGLLVSDPFHRTDELIRLLHLRRHQIGRAERPRRRLAVLRPRHS
jgi:hypothetical protein